MWEREHHLLLGCLKIIILSYCGMFLPSKRPNPTVLALHPFLLFCRKLDESSNWRVGNLQKTGIAKCTHEKNIKRSIENSKSFVKCVSSATKMTQSP